MDIANDFAGFQGDLQTALVATTRKISHITAQDIEFHRSLDSSVSSQLDRQNARLLALSERLLANAAGADAVGRPRLPDVEAIDTHWRGVVDAVDSLLEKADISLDEYTGAVKRLSPSRDSTPSRGLNTATSNKATSFRSANILKPQRLFEHPPDNADTSPFQPLLETKPHATVSLEASTKPDASEDGVIRYSHPYKQEIEQYQYPSFVYTRAEPIPYHDFDASTATFVDTEQGVLDMLKELKQAKLIAIDLEHHDTRSYVGIVSLMQISTRDKDWIVDTLQPWRRNLQCLNQVFADPSILKVLHGAMMDVIWLQRDLGLYIVGLFDTHHASKVLNYQGGSLAFLLKKFVDIDAQKQYQTADWRIRPLPQPLLDYARSDTHYLLYIFDNMRNELIRDSHLELPDHQGDPIHEVLVRSKRYALQTYTNDLYDADRGIGSRGWYKLVWKSPALLNNVQFAVFRALHRWRDTVAREQDDGLHYVMPNWNIFSLARELPTAKAALLGICQPPTETVRLRADELLAVIAQAKDEGQTAKEMYHIIKEIDVFLHGEREVEDPVPAADTVMSGMTTGPKNPFPTVTDTTSTRSTNSSFWGPILRKVQTRQITNLAPHLSVPLPPLTAEVFADPTSRPNKPATPEPEVEAVAEAKTQTEVNDIFTLKDRNTSARKRKSEQISTTTPNDNLAANADILSLHAELSGTGHGHDDLSKEQRRAARRARKAEKRASTGRIEEDAGSGVYGGAGARREQDEAEEFDYGAAKSVFYASRDADRAAAEARRDTRRRTEGDVPNGDATNNNSNKKRKNVDPFAKALDAPKGLPRAQRERAGKSMTFRN